MRMPAVFVGHGSPMMALEQNKFTKEWQSIGESYLPKAILVISAHWYTAGNKTQDDVKPLKINDMYGFPEALYSMTYEAQGNLALTTEICKSLGSSVQVDNTWGIDHGAWAVLVHMYPGANIPVVQLSVDYSKSPREQFLVGQQLAHLRDQGYMILGSGNVVHNLRRIDPSKTEPFSWASSFDDYIEQSILDKKYNQCVDYMTFGEASQLAVPTPDHFYPLLSVLGAVKETDQVRVYNKGYDLGSLSMTGYIFE